MRGAMEFEAEEWCNEEEVRLPWRVWRALGALKKP